MSLKHYNIGLVLAGGGAKGAYEVGVFKALWELELIDNINVISGTSIGAINALLLAMNNRSVIGECWSNLNYSRFIINQEDTRRSVKNFILDKIKNSEINIINQLKANDIGLLSQGGVKSFINEYVDMSIIRESKKDIYACAYNIDKERPEYFKLDEYNDSEIMDIVLASCAVPYVFRPIIINNDRYADGGIHAIQYSKDNIDNVPIYPLQSYYCDLIIVVHLSYKNKIDKSNFKDTNIVEIYPSTQLEFINAIGTINIAQSTIAEKINLGYRDALVTLSPIIINLLKGKDIKKNVDKINEQNKVLLNRN